jgi:hypothetical protein
LSHLVTEQQLTNRSPFSIVPHEVSDQHRNEMQMEPVTEATNVHDSNPRSGPIPGSMKFRVEQLPKLLRRSVRFDGAKSSTWSLRTRTKEHQQRQDHCSVEQTECPRVPKAVAKTYSIETAVML